MGGGGWCFRPNIFMLNWPSFCMFFISSKPFGQNVQWCQHNFHYECQCFVPINFFKNKIYLYTFTFSSLIYAWMSSPVFLPFSWRSLWGLRVGRLVRRYGVLKVIKCMVTRSHSPWNPSLSLPPPRHKSLTKTDPTAFAVLQELCCWSAGGDGDWWTAWLPCRWAVWELTNGAWFLHFLLTFTRWLTANQNKWQLEHQFSWACGQVWCNVVDSINTASRCVQRCCCAGLARKHMLPRWFPSGLCVLTSDPCHRQSVFLHTSCARCFFWGLFLDNHLCKPWRWLSCGGNLSSSADCGIQMIYWTQ